MTDAMTLLQYYFGNCFMLVLQVASALMLLVLVSEWSDFDIWAWIVVILGSVSFGLQLFVTVRSPPLATLPIDAAYLTICIDSTWPCSARTHTEPSWCATRHQPRTSTAATAATCTQPWPRPPRTRRPAR